MILSANTSRMRGGNSILQRSAFQKGRYFLSVVKACKRSPWMIMVLPLGGLVMNRWQHRTARRAPDRESSRIPLQARPGARLAHSHADAPSSAWQGAKGNSGALAD